MTALQDQISAWRHNRKLYPGWLVAPYQTRDKIWRNTTQWVEPAIAAGEGWSAPHLLILWRELSWRLGVCLQVVPDRAIDLIQRVGDALTDAVASTTDPKSQLFPEDDSWPADLVLPPSEFRDYWVECMLSQLVSYRLRPDVEAFSRVEQQILATGTLSQDQQCQICYQSCLSAFSELDRDRATQLVAAWPTEPEDPYWFVRKASVLLELGDRHSATAAAIEALARIRRRRRSDQSSFWGLSREGWCLRFLYQILRAESQFSQKNSVVEPIDIDAQRDRLDRELEIARCSPDTELRLLDERVRLRLPPARPEYRTTSSQSFDTGTTQRVIQFGADEPAERLAPAVNILMACDHTGLPPSIGYFAFFREAGKSALQWVRDEFPGLWAAFALRFRGIGIEGYQHPPENQERDVIRRTTLESLPLAHLERLFVAAIRELERTVNAVETNSESEDNVGRVEAIQTATRLVDAATRFSMCLDDQRREQAFLLGLRMSRIAVFRTHPAHRRMIWWLLQRVVPYLTVEVLNKWVVQLLIQYPLASPETQQLRGWPEITELIRIPAEASLCRPDTDDFQAGIKSFMNMVSSHDVGVRTGAAWRLLGIYKQGLLTDTERRTFQHALWGMEDAHGLPAIDDTYLAKFVHLQWPEEKKGRVIKGLNAWIASGAITDRFNVKAGETEGSGGRPYTITWPDPDRYLESLNDLARYVNLQPKVYATLFNEDARRYILNTILVWWTRERDWFRGEVNVRHPFGGNVFERIDVALQVIFGCALGRGVPDAGSKERLGLFLDDIDAFGMPNCFGSQVRAYLDGACLAEYWSRIRTGFWSRDPELATQALASAWQWQQARKRLHLPAMPRKIFLSLLGTFGKFQEDVTHHTYDLVSGFIENGQLRARDVHVVGLLDAVESAAFDLRYDIDRYNSYRLAPVDEESRPHLRRSLARLLVLLRQQEIALGPSAREWLEAAKTDRFVDVRQAAKRR